MELRPDFIGAHLSLGAAYRELNQIEQAKASFRRVLELNPNEPQAPTIRQWLNNAPD